ncbi:hypothetical protein IQ13_3235 [Lacibacter cauensis]|uniref:Lipocalin-like protein n=1 Tax=Lacibacter cauensis TaxID=510947 RepID=A0A562SH02_9BACT|nr:hypothetical protein [Lacibacter cauensis]TWI80557.1 hypothetical protein IQ13_3235 [Lacibacter cauensis]
MKPLIFIFVIFLISCGNANTNSGTRDTVVIIQQTPVNDLKETSNTNQSIVDSSAPPPIESNTQQVPDNAIEVGFDESNFIGSKTIQLQTFGSSCEHAGKGDMREEVWTISKKGNTYTLTAKAEQRTISKYTGTLNNNKLYLTGTYSDYLSGFISKGKLTLELNSENKISGERHIITENSDNSPCEIHQMIFQVSQ